MKPALLDVNVLIALIDPAHELHDAAHVWFARDRRFGWATCPVTENACLRILGKPGYPYLALSVAGVREILGEFCADAKHLFRADSVSVLANEKFDLSGVTPKQLTDVYLPGVASAQGGRLATFDRGIRWLNVTGANAASIEVLAGSL
jgi:hypothetical protein